MEAPRKLRLRWRFIFRDYERVGIWNGASGRVEDMAYAINKNGLRLFVIEGKDLNGIVSPMFELDGPLYVTSSWLAESRIPGGGFGLRGSVRLLPTIVGLEVVTPQKAFAVMTDGRIKTRELTEDERRFKIAEYR